ncbi:MAG: Gfo/Idh/MocA family protein [Candidatus Dormibacteria bacterium]
MWGWNTRESVCRRSTASWQPGRCSSGSEVLILNARSTLRIGLVGYGFMGRAHRHAYADLPLVFPDGPTPVVSMLAGRDAEGVRKAAVEFGVDVWTSDWHQLVESPEVDVVDICVAGDGHHEIAVAAARAGKHVLCEKPLANNLVDAREMLEAAEHAGVKHGTIFNYRYLPAVVLASRLIADGRIGRVRHIRGRFLQDWIVDPTFPLVWRLRKECAGSGALGDLGAHVVDMARFLVGEFHEVAAVSETFVRERPIMPGNGGAKGPVTVDDATLFIARLANSVLGTFEVTRMAPGHRCSHGFEINGSRGSLRFDFERLNELRVYLADDAEDVQGFRVINVNDPGHPYAGRWWPPGHGIGYEATFIHQLADFLHAVAADRPVSPSFADGVRCQEVLDAVEASAQVHAWVAINDRGGLL